MSPLSFVSKLVAAMLVRSPLNFPVRAIGPFLPTTRSGESTRAALVLRRIVTFALLVSAQAAHAYIYLNGIEPSIPKPWETTAVRFGNGICDAIIEAAGYPQITRTDRRIHMVLASVHAEDEFCNFAEGRGTLQVGQFPAGHYTLQVDRHYIDFFATDVVETVGTIDFDVIGSAESVPINSWPAVTVLALATGLCGLLGRPRKAPSEAGRKHRAQAFSAFLGIALLLSAPVSKAVMIVEGLLPNSPKAFEDVAIQIREGICDASIDAPGFPRLSHDGNKITLLLETIHEEDGYCNLPLGSGTWPIGALAPGHYIAEVKRHYVDFFGGDVVQTVGVIDFDAVGSLTPVPTLSLAGLTALSIGVAALAYKSRSARCLRRPSRLVARRSISICVLTAAALLLPTSQASAYLAVQKISPAIAKSWEPISVFIDEGYCDAVFDEEGYPKIYREASEIVLLLETAHEYGDFCIYPQATSHWSIGGFPPGHYDLRVDRHYDAFLAPNVTEVVGKIQFDVVSAATSVPTLSLASFVALALGIGACALVFLHRPRQTFESSFGPRWVQREPSRQLGRSIAAISLIFFASHAKAQMAVDSVAPASPHSGEEVYVLISEGACDAVLEVPGYPQVNREGDRIVVLLETDHEYGDFCVLPVVTIPISIGVFPPGRYILRVERHYKDFFPSDVVATLGVFDLRVSDVPLSLPILSLSGALIAALALCAIGIGALRKRAALCLCGLFVLSAFSEAKATPQYVEVLLSADGSAPAEEDVVDYFLLQPPIGSPPLAAFNSVMPDDASYLLPIRAGGNFKAWLDANPGSARAVLERYLLIRYHENVDIQNALASLQADPAVALAQLPLELDLLTPSAASPAGVSAQDAVDAYSQYGWSALNTEAARLLAGGYALVGDADTGLNVAHPALRQFSDIGTFLGGNFVAASSLDVGDWPDSFDFDVDEASPVAVPADASCNPDHLNWVTPAFAGHGTHVAGLIAANEASGLGVRGICRHCGIAMWKVTQHKCIPNTSIVPSTTNKEAVVAAVAMMGDAGVQVINLSLGSTSPANNFCTYQPNYPFCLALSYASSRDLVIVASSGNARTHIVFPASDPRTIAVGGFDSSLQLWDESPGSTIACPYPPGSLECGSNYTVVQTDAKQETVASARKVFSTTYPGKDWNTTIHCGDSFGPKTGVGLCTGTSMSAPQISGLMGILRSINPLVPVGHPGQSFGSVVGLRTVLAQTTSQAQGLLPWTATLGYGRPDAAAAAARMLGQVEGHTVRNRATPLFRFHGAVAKDYVDTTTPQMAVAFVLNQTDAYLPQGALVPGYAAFPQEPNTTPLPAPRANVYVLTTEYSPRPEWPALVPLYLMERTRSFPAGCTVGTPGCNADNRDFSLFSAVADIEAAHADGYSLRTIQGYVYQPCAPEPACIPPGAQKLWRACKPQDDDCAVFLENERSAFEADGYLAAYPPGAGKLLGYAYPAIDSDGDGLIDGFEYAIGTRVDAADSDGDGASDGEEFPMIAVAASDPCSGSGGANCPADVLFRDGFQ